MRPGKIKDLYQGTVRRYSQHFHVVYLAMGPEHAGTSNFPGKVLCARIYFINSFFCRTENSWVFFPKS